MLASLENTAQSRGVPALIVILLTGNGVKSPYLCATILPINQKEERYGIQAKPRTP